MLMMAYITFGQSAERASEIRAAMWGKESLQYINTTIPDKWKNESAVILYQEDRDFFDKKSNRLYNEKVKHIRIALLDKAAVERYSTFAFNEVYTSNNPEVLRSKCYTYTGFKLIKPDGQEEIIDLNEAVTSKTADKFIKKKIAIPNLQVGDILDYYYFYDEELIVSPHLFVFAPAISDLSSNYSIVFLKKEFDVEKNFYISYKAVNGAPELQEIQNEKRRIFTLEAEDIPKAKGMRWMYPYRSLPTIKFQVTYRKNGLEIDLNDFYRDAKEIKSQFTKEDISMLVSRIKVPTKFNQKGFTKTLKKKGLNIDELSKEVLAEEIYFFIYKEQIANKYGAYLRGEIEYPKLNQYYWVQLMYGAFNRNKIESKLIIAPDGKYSNREDLLFIEELKLMIKLKDSDFYLSNYFFHPKANQIPVNAQGVEAYQTNWSHGKRAKFLLPEGLFPKVESITLPKESIEQNVISIHSDVQLNRDMSGMSFKNSCKVTGQCIKFYRPQSVVIDEDSEAYQKERLKVNRELLIDNFDVEDLEITSYEMISSGKYQDDLFHCEIDFTVDGLIQKAGTNYLLNAGMLISTETKVQEIDREERKVDVYWPAPSNTYECTVSVTIPDGYSVEGIEKLNKHIENEAGGLIATASLDGNQLNISFKDWTSNPFEPKENWAQVLTLLEAGEAFNEIKVLLKKQ